MNLVDVVEIIGDRITEIDMAIARLAPSDPDAATLMELRLKLDKQQQLLVKQAFDENSAKFQQAAAELKTVNDEMGDSIRNIDRIATVIEDVNKFLMVASNLVTTVSKL